MKDIPHIIYQIKKRQGLFLCSTEMIPEVFL